MTFLLDTNVVAEISKPRADVHLRSWFDGVKGSELFLSVLVLGEIRQGIERLRPRHAERAEQLDAWLAILQQEYAERVLGGIYRGGRQVGTVECGQATAGDRRPTCCHRFRTRPDPRDSER